MTAQGSAARSFKMLFLLLQVTPPFSEEMFDLALRCCCFLLIADLYDSPFISRMWT